MFEIDAGPVGSRVTVKRDGEDISSSLYAVDLHAAVDRITRLTLYSNAAPTKVTVEPGRVEWRHNCVYCKGHEDI